MSNSRVFAVLVSAIFVLISFSPGAHAYNLYTDGCESCHGGFRDEVSTKGSVFPSDDKHEMHRANGNMNAECTLCHISIGDNPPLASSGGTSSNPAIGCMGCHGRVEDAGGDTGKPGWGAGLRQHHTNNGIGTCAICHTDADPLTFETAGEHFEPPYYGTADTNSDNSCNPVQAAETNENWTIGDFVGMDNDGDNVYDGSDTDCPANGMTAGDFKYDGRADILWRNATSGQNWLHEMDGATIDASSGINTVSNLNWQVVGNGDYDGNGTADILWRNSSTGENWMYLMIGKRPFASEFVNKVGDQNWRVVGSGDYDGDGNSDILWRNSSTGQNWMYLMDGASIVTSTLFNKVGDQDWKIVGSGDFDADGDDDILMRHSSTGQNWMYLTDGAMLDTSSSVNTVSNPATHVAGIGDYNSDGADDIIWHNDVTGRIWMYLMNGTMISSFPDVVTVANTDWEVAGDGDYDGDGDADILIRNSVTGQNWMYLMNGSTVFDSTPVNTVSNTQWQIVHLN